MVLDMTEVLEKDLACFHGTLAAAEKYAHAAAVLSYDQETICPEKAMEEQGEVGAMLQTEAFRLIKGEAFISALKNLHGHTDELDEFDAAAVEKHYRSFEKTANITPEMNHEFALVYNRAFVNWLEAKNKADFSVFAPSLKEVRDIEIRKVGLRDSRMDNIYDNLLDDYEKGMTTGILDETFSRCAARLRPLLKKIMSGGKEIRTDFLSRPVSDAQQAEMARYLMEVLKYDFSRGAFTTTEHPFTSKLGRNDIRITTHYHADSFASSMYSIIHESGHALFEMLSPSENDDHHLDGKTMGQHESVSRFYENRIGRSEAFIHLIYPKTCEIFPQVMHDVSEREFYEAMNLVTPSLIRTEADEFTYTFHIIIRYEIEKLILSGEAAIEDLPRIWNDKYEEYLGIRPENDREGVLQDTHWTFGFGYFPTYALGNMYNAMYFHRMEKDLDIDALVRAGDFDAVNGWMKENVFKKADRLDPGAWLREITGKEFAPDDFLDYLEEKYSGLYGL